VVEDGLAHRHPDPAPDYSFALLWGADRLPNYPDDGARQVLATTSPRPGGVRFVQLVVHPGRELSEIEHSGPRAGRAGILTRSGDRPGVHFTSSLDLIVVLEGEVWLELDDGAQTHLKAGDALVQNGTRHAWRNHGDVPARLGVVAIGTHHDLASGA
jgi:quercetin dioxygenase-like cupin family protein